MQPTGDHQVKDQVELALHFYHDSLPDSSDVDHEPTAGFFQRGVDRPQQEGAVQANSPQLLAT